MTNADVAGLLRKYAAAKAHAKELRVEMLQVAVEDCGLTQEAAMKIDITTFLDGYLVGQGMLQPHRQPYTMCGGADS